MATPPAARGQNVFLFDGIKKDVNDKEFYYEEFCYKQFNVKQHTENGELPALSPNLASVSLR